MKYQALYTETLHDLLLNKNYGEENEDKDLRTIIEKLGKFPSFSYEGVSFNFLDLFIEKYDIREIGAETEELFMHNWNEKTNEILINYMPKISMWLQNFADLFKFTVDIKTTDKNKNSSGSQDTVYYNPANANTGVEKTIEVDEVTGKTLVKYSGGNLKVQNVGTTDNNGTSVREINTQKLQAIWGKTRADILAKILELKDIYMDCLNAFETIFMGVY